MTVTNSDRQLRDLIVLDKLDLGQIPSDYLDHYFTHILCQGGRGQFQLGNKTYQIVQNDIAIWLPSAKVTDLLFTPDFEATILLVSYKTMSMNNPDTVWGIKGYLFSKENPVVSLSEEDKARCYTNFMLLKEKDENTRHRFKKEILNCQIQLFIMDMWDIFSNEIERRLTSHQQRGSVFERFLLLVQEHCMEHRELDFYSGKLFITSKYLTELCKKNSGKTATEWIQNYTTQRIIILLKNKNLTFTEIADRLHFSSQSFFSRYVRQELGVSPSEYRQRLE